MIQDKDTNIIYFSKNLKNNFSEICNHITDIFKANDVKYKFLEKTKDIWTRDYMPIQVSDNKFIEYRYDPDYLQGVAKDCRDIKTYPDMVCDSIGLKTIKTDIILDGGNVIRSSNCVILTDKIVNENHFRYTKKELIEKLKGLFEVDRIILIPWDKNEDKYGHADGMIRFIDDDTVLMQEYYDKEINNKIFSIITKEGFKIEKLKFRVENFRDDLNWAYLNFLQTKDVILIPKLGIAEDEQALKQIENFFPDNKSRNAIFQIPMVEIVKKDGALNCISWTTKNY